MQRAKFQRNIEITFFPRICDQVEFLSQNLFNRKMGFQLVAISFYSSLFNRIAKGQEAPSNEPSKTQNEETHGNAASHKGVRPSLRHCETSCSVAHGGSVCRMPLKQEIWTRIYALNFQPLCLEFPKKVDQLISYFCAVPFAKFLVLMRGLLGAIEKNDPHRQRQGRSGIFAATHLFKSVFSSRSGIKFDLEPRSQQ